MQRWAGGIIEREREVSFAAWISCESNRPTVFATTTTDNLN